MTTQEPTQNEAVMPGFHTVTVTGDTDGRVVVTTEMTGTVPDKVLLSAADMAPRVLGEYVGAAVACVLGDHSEDETPDPNVHELANRVLVLAGINQTAGA